MSLLLAGALTGCDVGLAAHEPGGTSVRTQVAPSRGAFHENQPYRLQNSFRGLRLAARAGTWIDIDSNYCWDTARRHRIPLATHWPHIGADHFTDPAGRIDPDAAFADLTLPEVRRLRSTDPVPYRISTMEEMVREAARIGVPGIEWEVKGGTAFERPATYRGVLAAAAEAGIEVNVKTLTNIGGTKAALRRLRAAARAGATTMLLNHSARPVRITAAESRYVDYVRGPWRAGQP
ncbi:hypothetical protein [Nocardioides koreensis]|uniref:hypothetical protein n=1 Tax=Nocardioides koreensis TaxID=433651 RepID=UPI0031DA656D